MQSFWRKMNYLPSKNFIAVVGSALVIIFVGYFVIYIVPIRPIPNSLTSHLPPPTSFIVAYQDAQKDSDNDGLKDWEEILWKTDLLKPDTDGDGALDSEEIKLGRDPLVKGPNDKLKTPEEAKKSGEAVPKTLTKNIAQRFAAEYLTALGTSEGNPDIFQKKSIAESLIASLAGETVKIRDTFMPVDIAIQSNVSPEFIKNYLNATGLFLEKNFAGLEETEISILEQALATENFEELKKLDKYAGAYKKAVEFLKKQKVPVSYAILHLELMNIFNNTALAVGDMQKIESDPAKGLIGFSIYLKQTGRGPEAYKAMKKQIISDKITLSPGEGGYHFLK